MRTSLFARRHQATHDTGTEAAHAGPRSSVVDDQVAGPVPIGGRRLTDVQSASLLDRHEESEGKARSEIGDAIAVLMARYQISYTKAFAAMIASGERTHRSMPELAEAVIKTDAREPRRVCGNYHNRSRRPTF